MYYFYILYSSVDRGYYYGSTVNLRRRFSEHTSGKVVSTKHRLPLELVYYEAYNHLELARTREQQVKQSGSIRTALHKRFASKENGFTRPPKGKTGH